MSTFSSSFSTRSSTGSDCSSAASQKGEGKKSQAALQGPFLPLTPGPAPAMPPAISPGCTFYLLLPWQALPSLSSLSFRTSGLVCSLLFFCP